MVSFETVLTGFFLGQLTSAITRRALEVEGVVPFFYCLPFVILFLPASQYLSFGMGTAWQSWWEHAIPLAPALGRFWFLRQSQPEQEFLFRWLEDSFLSRYLLEFQSQKLQNLWLWDETWAPYLMQYVWGLTGTKTGEWKSLYQELGLLHVLVISGGHVAFLSQGLSWLLLFPLQKSYQRLWLRLPGFLLLTCCARGLQFFLISAFSWLVGWQAPCQRAWIFSVWQMMQPYGALSMPRDRQIKFLFCLQSLCFPLSFLSLSNLLTWSAFLLLVFLPDWPRLWQQYLLPRIEVPLLLVQWVYLGQAPLSALYLNPLLRPCWTLLLGLGLGASFFPKLAYQLKFAEVLELVHAGLRAVLRIERDFMPHFPPIHEVHTLLYFLLWLASLLIFARIWRQSSVTLP